MGYTVNKNNLIRTSRDEITSHVSDNPASEFVEIMYHIDSDEILMEGCA